jgi:hypothetical protein
MAPAIAAHNGGSAGRAIISQKIAATALG